MLHTRPIAVGPFRVTFGASDPRIIARWDDLYAGFPDAEPGSGTEELRVSISRGATGVLVSMLGGIPLLEHPDLTAHELEITASWTTNRTACTCTQPEWHATAAPW